MLERNGSPSEANASSQGLPDCIDIRDAVYLHMAPENDLDAVSQSARLNDGLESAVFRRLFPGIREEAVFWHRAGKGRGVVLWTETAMQFVPMARIGEMFRVAKADTRAAAVNAANSYDPLRQAVVVIVLAGFEAVASLAPEDTTLHSMQKLAGSKA